MEKAKGAITGRFQDRNAEQISQTATCTEVRHVRQDPGSLQQLLNPNFCLKHKASIEKHLFFSLKLINECTHYINVVFSFFKVVEVDTAGNALQ